MEKENSLKYTRRNHLIEWLGIIRLLVGATGFTYGFMEPNIERTKMRKNSPIIERYERLNDSIRVLEESSDRLLDISSDLNHVGLGSYSRDYQQRTSGLIENINAEIEKMRKESKGVQQYEQLKNQYTLKNCSRNAVPGVALFTLSAIGLLYHVNRKEKRCLDK